MLEGLQAEDQIVLHEVPRQGLLRVGRQATARGVGDLLAVAPDFELVSWIGVVTQGVLVAEPREALLLEDLTQHVMGVLPRYGAVSVETPSSLTCLRDKPLPHFFVTASARTHIRVAMSFLGALALATEEAGMAANGQLREEALRRA